MAASGSHRGWCPKTVVRTPAHRESARASGPDPQRASAAACHLLPWTSGPRSAGSGPRRAWSFPCRRRIYMKASDALQANRDALRALAARHRLRNLRVFGSAATGADTEGSDIDLLVD